MHAHEVEPLNHCTRPLLVDRKAEIVEGSRPAYPGLVIGPESSGEDDRAEAAQVEPVECDGAEGLRFRYFRHRQSTLGNQFADATHELCIPLIAPGHALVKVAREMCLPALSAQEVAEQRHPQPPQRSVVEVVTAAVSCRLRVAGQPRG